MRERDFPLITRSEPKAPDRLTVERKRGFSVKVTLTAADLFALLGIEPPPPETQVHILLARSHGNEGSCYDLVNGGLNVVEIRMKWELPEDL